MTTSKDTTNSSNTVVRAGSAVAGTVRQTASSVRARLPELSTGQKVAAAGVAAAALAGVTKLVMNRRRSGSETVLRVQPLESEGWQLVVDGESSASASFETKEEALSSARQLARESAPSELVVHRTDGTEQDRHVYAAE